MQILHLLDVSAPVHMLRLAMETLWTSSHYLSPHTRSNRSKSLSDQLSYWILSIKWGISEKVGIWWLDETIEWGLFDWFIRFCWFYQKIHFCMGVILLMDVRFYGNSAGNAKTVLTNFGAQEGRQKRGWNNLYCWCRSSLFLWIHPIMKSSIIRK